MPTLTPALSLPTEILSFREHVKHLLRAQALENSAADIAMAWCIKGILFQTTGPPSPF